ncbi:MAG: chalcone isomerase family protein [Proteobacteria bacterium]|nr:chalcone isomerase family protein [Pseudomonadota bacterium]
MKTILTLFIFLIASLAQAQASPNSETHWVNIGEGTYGQGFLFPYKVKLFVPYGERSIHDIKEGVIPLKFELDWLLIDAPEKKVRKIFTQQIREHYPSSESYTLSKNIINLFLKKLPTVKKHDSWAFEYYPDEGTKLYINNQKIHHLVGAELNRALIQSWLNQSPVLTSNLFIRLIKLQ